ncbi:hypothetical protein J5N97_003063 [Dioscorea zingiberensis]|uniref:Uncharacterized protein n=1 Tax=Dioscorea zingiberensis TaxID=325984 RepID=A0A9D5HQZ5_9LILI|nr:hypothetical protein J5N97_003063 [Dioscorea zingiberensis]
MVRSELPTFLRVREHLTDNWDVYRRAQRESFGRVVHTFYELEREYCELLRGVDCRKAWFIGPLDLFSKGGGHDHDHKGKVERGEGRWPWGWRLRDGVSPGREIGDHGEHPQEAEWMPGKDGRRECKGRGWLGLREANLGVAWPVFDHFISERLVVEVLKVGVRVWDGFRSTFEKEKVVVPAEAIERAVRKFMEGSGTEGEEMRKRAAEWAEVARAAVAEGGSSHRDLNSLIDEIFVAREKTKDESE